MPIPSQVRKTGRYILLLDNLFIVLGFYVVFPLVSTHFVSQVGWSALFVGFALGFRQFVQQGFGLIGGAIADRFGAKPMIITGMFLRSIGFISMALATEHWLLLISCLLSALGGLLFDPPRMGLTIKFTRPHERGKFISLLMIQDNAGAVIGALIGGILIDYDFQLVCWCGAFIFFLCGIFNLMYLPAYHIAIGKAPIINGMKMVLKDRKFTHYVLTLTGYYVLWVQIMLMLPLTITNVSGSPSYVKWMYAIQATISLCLLYPLARISEKYFRLDQRLKFGLLLMSFAFIIIGFTSQLSILLSLIALFYFGAIIAEPARETLATVLTNPKAKGSYMGFSRLGLALGGFIGYTGAGWLYDVAIQIGLPHLPWVILTLVGLLTLGYLEYLFKNEPPMTKVKMRKIG
ncbi:MULTISPECIES: multidrug efflux MFS transporter MdtH [unclassified Gilliamella]|uniref:multidrug efflux MFS transporter MdtH n=1 Tax=unclassified Gilliamella TaxID=2685620 RepID=UPI0018DC10B6|nr:MULTISPECIES: multidrug efflux MFS transporter MdtH [unclassified Gilliamella]MBI0038459.1 multidrug efflux MFS transporter MdtH [Gilliamella sp. B14384G10]MBI0040244.1 multidrug efflux MFS transporter MdtH [Gilliamella sp. B14384G7]MBI0052084.1 multidrug efflux MFS transporter MdtH [Gilliamella sp. B14384G13]MBI0054746.1 multidrug efflux MFS transporter MdtH [Gilliamella sp. B14384H2]MBI0104009.1 multidrug efflux MFS transporter MdtH [Gilliamella sp. W8145]